MPLISQFLDNELEQRELFLSFLKSLGLDMLPLDLTSMRSDGMLYTSGSHRFLLCNLEVKSDFPNGGGAYMQNVCYYSKFIETLAQENSDVAARTCFPAFLITLEGISILAQLFLFIFR